MGEYIEVHLHINGTFSDDGEGDGVIAVDLRGELMPIIRMLVGSMRQDPQFYGALCAAMVAYDMGLEKLPGDA
jgi:hypothetical protein